jgi:transcriptional regulator with XRE-family HTH domain
MDMAKRVLWNERLKQERLRLSLSQADLARELNVSPKAVQRWETGKNYPQPHWRAKLCEFFHLSPEALGFLSKEGKVVPGSKDPAQSVRPGIMTVQKQYIVGRQAEVQLFDELLTGRADYWLLNIYGPGGIGKSVVCEKLRAHAHSRKVPVAAIDGYYPDLTPDRVLYNFKQTLIEGPFGERLEDAFHDFNSQLRDYFFVNHVMTQGGGLHALFDTFGNIKDPAGFAAILAGLSEIPPESLQRTMHNRFALDRYLRGAERSLTTCFVNTLSAIQEELSSPIVMFMDTYEEMEQLDNWVCRTLVPSLPPGIRLVILGRNQLHHVNFDWREYEDALHTRPLPELSESDAKAYLRYYGLTDPIALQRIYEFTHGYPLLLVLVRLLAREAGGWEKIGTLEQSRDRDFIAAQLLELILREERARQVREFLEKGAVVQWFDPETITIILDVDLNQARTIYDKLQRHSFVERHPFGARLHDKIRELLEERLKFTSKSEYDRLKDKLAAYYAAKAGITPAK